jgi:hypothetical protein
MPRAANPSPSSSVPDCLVLSHRLLGYKMGFEGFSCATRPRARHLHYKLCGTNLVVEK